MGSGFWRFSPAPSPQHLSFRMDYADPLIRAAVLQMGQWEPASHTSVHTVISFVNP
jgi:hypothetical protein